MNKKLKIAIATCATAFIVGSGFVAYKMFEIHPVSYDLDGGTMVTKNPVEFVRWIDDAKAPKAKKEHYIFKGWTDGQTTMASIKHARNDVVLKAVWEPETYEITFKDGKDEISKMSYTYGSKTKLPAKVDDSVAKKHPYEDFKAWILDNKEIKTLSENDFGDKVITAKFTGKEYKITYDLYNGTADGLPESYQYGKGVESFTNASLDAYAFDGWYSDEACTKKVENIAKDSHEDVHLYAGYHKKPIQEQTVSYSGNSTSRNNGGSYTASTTGSASSATPSGNYVSIPAIGWVRTLTDDPNGFDAPGVASINWSWIYGYDDNIEDYLTMPQLSDHASDGLSRLGERVPIGSQVIINWNGNTRCYTVTNSFITDSQFANDNSHVRGNGATVCELGLLNGHSNGLCIRTCTPDNNGNYVLICD